MGGGCLSSPRIWIHGGRKRKHKEQIYTNNNLATIYHLLAASTGKENYFGKARTHYRKELDITPDHPTAERMLTQINKLEELLVFK